MKPPATPPAPAAAADRDRRKPAERSASPLARGALLTYLVLLAYGSLAPWQGWRSLGVGPFAYLFAPWPAYVTAFDLALNVLAYAPLGILLVLALQPRLRGLPAAAAAVAAAAVVSVSLECLQTYLPSRIASNVDVLTNLIGAAAGATAGLLLAPALLDGRQLQQLRRRWFRPRSTAVLLLVALWPLAQIHPAPMLFGNGELNRDLVATLLAAFGVAMPVFDAGRFAAAEVLVTASGMLAVAATLGAGTRLHSPRLRLLLAVLAAALLTKAIAYGHEFGVERALAWLTPGAVSGLAVGLLAVTAAVTATNLRAASAVAVAALLVLLVVVNAVPPNPYHAHWLAAWQPGRLRNVVAVSEWLATAWPVAMLGALLWSRPSRRRRRVSPSG